MSPHDLQVLIQTCAVACVALGTLLPLARALARRIATPRQVPAIADADRTARMEAAIEAMALEVERIAEGQRFMAKLLAGGDGAAASARLPVPRDASDR